MPPYLRPIRLLLLACLGILATNSPTLAAPPTGNDQPINIEADRMVSHQKDNAVLFAGNVTARQGELSIRADEMTVQYHPEEEKGKQPGVGGGQLKKLMAKGNVHVESAAWIASGDTMDYLAAERKVLLNGNAKVWQDNNVVSGNAMTLYLDEGKSIVERSPGKGERVKAFFYPAGESPAERK